MAAISAPAPPFGGEYFRQDRSFASRLGTGTLRFIKGKPMGAFGAAMLIIIVVVAAFSPWIATHDLFEQDKDNFLQAPTTAHWFGTDENGRDVFSRIVYGCQVTALVGIGTVILVSILSLVVGIASGYFGGKLDFVVQRVVDIWLSFPAIFLILTLLAVLSVQPGTGGVFGLGRGPDWGPDPNGGQWFWNTLPRTTIVTLALGLVLAGGASRVVRSAVLSTKANPYVEAATVVGASSSRIILKHILPNIMATVIVLATLQLGTAILAEATISFLGQGVTNFPTWGQMLAGNRLLFENHVYLIIFPGIAIFLAVFGFNMLGDALRDVLDPRLRGSR
ncbi:MAG: ABC transporter permease [Dehalococcoidia bacterium]